MTRDAMLAWYFQTLGLKPSSGPDAFLDGLEEKYGESVVSKLVSILQARANEEDEEQLYDFKNQTLDFSLDFAKYSADLYDKFLKWFLSQEFESPKRLLDLGCDNGIITCFYGHLFPNSEVVGVDICAPAVRCAAELASHFQLKNVRFLTLDLTDSSKFSNLGRFEMITSLRSMQEIYGYFPEFSYGPLEHERIQISERFSRIHAISHLVQKENGIFVSCERIPGLDECIFYTELLKQAGLYTDFSLSGRITFHELGERQEMPAFVATQKEREQNIREELSRFYKKGTNLVLHPGSEYEGPIAEVIFSEMEEKQFIEGICITEDEKIEVHYELWKTRDLLLRYQFSNRGHRELHILHPDRIEIAKQSLRILVAMKTT